MIEIESMRLRGAAIGRRLRRLARFARYVFGRFRADGCFAASGALSYTTLVSLVPLLAISLAVLSAFPIFDKLRSQALLVIFDAFVPRVGGTVEQYITSFVAMAGKTTAVGIVVLAVTATMLLATIEDRLNEIWRVHAPRAWGARIAIYWTVLTLGPVLFGLALSLPGNFDALAGALDETRSARILLIWVKGLTFLAPLVLESLGLMVFYCLIPHGPVRWRDGLIGGFVGAAMIEANRWVFTYYIDHFNSYAAIYGALATVPIFLLWTYLTWSVILFGAEVAAAVPLWQSREDPAEAAEPDFLALALGILEALAAQAVVGGPIAPRRIAATLGFPLVPVVTCLDRLSRSGFVAATLDGGFVLARDLEAATLLDLDRAVATESRSGAAHAHPGNGRRIEARLAAVRQAEAAALAVPVATFIESGRTADTG